MIASKRIDSIRDNLTKPSIKRELLEKTSVLKSAILARLKLQFLPSATVATDSGITLTHVKTEGGITPSLLKIQPIDTQPLIAIQDGNYEESSQLEKINQLSFFEGFNCLDLVAVTGNNLKQERRKLLKTVLQHHTIVDVFLCLSFANSLFTGELRLALVRLWRGGRGNKPYMGEYRVPPVFSGFLPSLPPYLLGQSSKKLPVEKV